MLTQLVYILDRKYKADRMLNFVLMRSAFCRGVMEPRLPQSPSLLISGSGSWPQLSLSRSLLPQKHVQKIYHQRFAPVKKFELDL